MKLVKFKISCLSQSLSLTQLPPPHHHHPPLAQLTHFLLDNIRKEKEYGTISRLFETNTLLIFYKQ